jgi:hypothetical protein
MRYARTASFSPAHRPKSCRWRNGIFCFDPRIVTTGHSRLKNGVASLAYDPMVHASVKAAWIAGSFCIKTALTRLLSGNDETELFRRKFRVKSKP